VGIELLNIDNIAYMKSCKDKQFDLAVVDPPYDIPRFKTNVESKMMNGFKNKLCGWDFKPTKEYWDELFRVSKNQIVWGGNYFTDNLPQSRCWIYWDKKKYVPNFASGELAWTSFDRLVIDVKLQMHGFLNPDGKKIHPTQKPVPLYNWIYENFSQKGDYILDTHLGSGSSAIAAHYFGVNFVGCEIDKQYFDNAVNRFNNETLQTKLFC
jgi:site-specific DNA-methyltransferase (adenine-specific)